MGDKTGIAWTDATWNPVRGCSRVSPGCMHCYAEIVASRFDGPGLPYEGLIDRGATGTPRWNGTIRLVPEKLSEPIHWQRRRRIFVNSMSDLFHEEIPDEYIDRVFAVMISANHHTYQILTKRPQRARAYLTTPGRHARWTAAFLALPARDRRPSVGGVVEGWWPRHSRHIWLGVSVEDQERANERIPVLLNTPAAVRFISAEPLLGAIDLSWSLEEHHHDGSHPKLDWAIVGGESQRGARPMDLDWARTLIRQCKTSNTPVFMKQLGSVPIQDGERVYGAGPKGDDPEQWAEDLRVREFPDA